MVPIEKTWKQFYALDPQPIGRGGQAEVMRARDRLTGAYCALKRVLSSSPNGLARMRREVQAQRLLAHPNIMPVLRHSASYSWYSMPLARIALSSMIPPIDDPLVVRVLDATLAALEVAHERGFIHRDITPTNILDIGKDTEQWVLADWGLVRPPSGTTVTRTQTGTFGTEAFAAPETWIDAHVADHRADIYSLGRVVAWCVTGSPLIPNVPLVPQGRWKDLVENATAFRPGERCQTLNDFRLLLSNVIAIPADEETELFGPIDSAMAAPLDLMESVLKEMNRLDIDLPWPISGPFASYFSLRIVTGYVAAGRMDSAVRAILRYSGLGQERAEKLVETLHRVLEVVRK